MLLQLSNTKQTGFRKENLLMIVPAILIALTSLFIKSAELDTHYPNTYFSFSFGNVVFFSWSLLIIPFLLHLFLQQQQISFSVVRNIHILLSLFLLVGVLFSYELLTPVSMFTDETHWGLPFHRKWLEATSATYILLISQFLVQGIFSVYAILKLIP